MSAREKILCLAILLITTSGCQTQTQKLSFSNDSTVRSPKIRYASWEPRVQVRLAKSEGQWVDVLMYVSVREPEEETESDYSLSSILTSKVSGTKINSCPITCHNSLLMIMSDKTPVDLEGSKNLRSLEKEFLKDLRERAFKGSKIEILDVLLMELSIFPAKRLPVPSSDYSSVRGLSPVSFSR